MRHPLVQAAAALLACAALLAGLISLGQMMRERLRDSSSHQIPFNDINCAYPPQMDRAAFLGEVRYHGEFPEQIPLLDDELPGKLAEAFAKHAWVERVDKVVVGPDRAVTVRLTFRTPVLIVQYAVTGTSARSLTSREVDGAGVLLPRSRDASGLPRLKPAVAPPAGGAGQPWGNKLVERAATLAALLHPHQPQLHLSQFDFANGEFRLTAGGGATVIWGNAPGAETNKEPKAAAKLQRLLDYCDKHGTLDRPDATAVYDLRTAEN